MACRRAILFAALPLVYTPEDTFCTSRVPTSNLGAPHPTPGPASVPRVCGAFQPALHCWWPGLCADAHMFMYARVAGTHTHTRTSHVHVRSVYDLLTHAMHWTYAITLQDEKRTRLNTMLRYYPHPKKPKWIQCARMKVPRFVFGLASFALAAGVLCYSSWLGWQVVV